MAELGEADDLLSQIQPKHQKALADWLRLSQRQLRYAQWQAGPGYTSAKLLGAYVAEKGKRVRGVVLKIWSGLDDVPGEPDRHRNALVGSPQFARNHLVELAYDALPLGNGGYIMFQRVAGGGFSELDTLGNLMIHQGPTGLDRIAVKCRAIMTSILSDWATETNMESMEVDRLLQELLGPRLHKGGTIYAWASHHAGLLADPRLWLQHDGTEVVNPFALVMDPEVSVNHIVTVLRGKSHGDLHPNNILVPRKLRERPSAYWLVDLSRYDDSALLTWDPVYLATTVIAPAVSELNSYQRGELARLYLDASTPCSDERLEGMCEILQAIDESGISYANEYDIKSEWQQNVLLSKVAVCLVMSGRQILSSDDREWFFWLAAKAATELIRQWNLYLPQDACRLPRTLIDSKAQVRRGAGMESKLTPSGANVASTTVESTRETGPIYGIAGVLPRPGQSAHSGEFNREDSQPAHYPELSGSPLPTRGDIRATEHGNRPEDGSLESSTSRFALPDQPSSDTALVDSYRPINRPLTVTTNQLNVFTDELSDELNDLRESYGPEVSYDDLAVAREIVADSFDVLAKISQAIVEEQSSMDVDVARARLLGIARVALSDISAAIRPSEQAISLGVSFIRPMRRLREAVNAIRVPDALSVHLDLG